jgi:hypothetical protein
MLYVRVEKKTGRRYMVYDKNRRGMDNKKLYMDLVAGDMIYDIDQFRLDYDIDLTSLEVSGIMESLQNLGGDIAVKI